MAAAGFFFSAARFRSLNARQNFGSARPTSSRPIIANSSAFTIDSTPASRIFRPVEPKNSNCVSGLSSLIAVIREAACASPDASPATIMIGILVLFGT
jgi:hypothetical protein